MLIEIDNLKFSYNSPNNHNFILNIPYWKLKERSFTILLGPNGSGKSTLLKILMKIIDNYTGSIRLNGKELKTFSRKDYAKIVAYVPQTIVTLFPYTVYEIVMMGRTPYLNLLGFETKEDKSIVNEILEMLEISHLRKKGINEISGGELQRVIIAKALAQKPKIILLDEPNAHLDIEHQITIFNLLNKLKEEQNLTLLAVSHDLNLAGIYSDEISFIVDGEIIISGLKQNVLTEENIQNVFHVHTKIFKSKENNIYNVLINPNSSGLL